LRLEALHGDPVAISKEIHSKDLGKSAALPKLSFNSRLSKEEYIQRIVALKEHIRNGDCYEINYCNEAFVEGITVNARDVFRKLNAASPAPFAAFYQNDGQFMLSASPERFIAKDGNVVRSQPIKGTARRGAYEAEDERLKEELRSSEKEQAENVMIVDLVRNDLARSCEVGSIEVEELFGIYSFPRVHQMISTVRGKLRDGVPFADAIRYAFPMGSMTGAPKHKVMQLIDLYEAARRDLFSGSVGYISPDGDFDFSVVIRSLFYNADTRYLSYQTGGAITWGSNPESEWEELRLKAAAMERIFA
jgi:para-aminobenzoate synthetase component 1